MELTLEMVQHLILCEKIARKECPGPGCVKCEKKAKCDPPRDWLNEQEARLKGEGK